MKLFPKIALFIMTIVFFSAIIEIVLHFVMPVTYNLSTPDEEFHHTLVKNAQRWQRFHGHVTFVETDSNGFRSRNFPFEKDADVKRVMILGDSIIANIEAPHDRMITTLLENKLNNLSGNWEVMNRGVESWDAYLEYLYFMKAGKKYTPDIVVVVFNMGNDFIDVMNNAVIPEFDNTVPLVDKFHPLSLFARFRFFLNQNSGIYRLFHSFYYNNLKKHENVLDGFFSRGYDDFFYNGTRKIETVFGAFKQQATDNNFSLIVVVHSDPRAVNKKYYDYWANKRKNYIPFENLQKPAQMISSFMATSNITFIDDTKYINEFDDYISLEDGHLSEKGGRKLAELMFEKIREVAGQKQAADI